MNKGTGSPFPFIMNCQTFQRICHGNNQIILKICHGRSRNFQNIRTFYLGLTAGGFCGNIYITKGRERKQRNEKVYRQFDNRDIHHFRIMDYRKLYRYCIAQLRQAVIFKLKLFQFIIENVLTNENE